MWTVGVCAPLFVCAPLSLAEQVAAPIITPPAGEYSPDPVGSGNPPVTLTMTSATEGATIYFLIRDNNVISVFPTYLPPYDPANKPVIAQAGTRWVGAMAVKAGMENSDVVWQEYKINAPVIELVGYLSFGQVSISTTSEKLISIYNRGNMDLTITSITMESDDPGAWSHDFSGPLVLLPSRVTYLRVTFAPTEVKEYTLALTIESDAAGGSNLRSGSGNGFDPTKVAPITITSTLGEPYYAPAQIQMYSYTSGASLRYTIDGSEPTEDSPLYESSNKPTLNTLGQVVVKARGFKDGLTPSDIASRTFSVVERELTANDDFFFDPTKIGEHKDKALVLANVGSRPIEISLIEADSGNWSVPDWTGPVTIPIGGSKSYTVRFNPVERFDLFGTLTISTDANGGDITRYLSGFGLSSGYGLDPKTKTVGSEGATYSVYVDGSGEWTPVETLDWVSVEDHSNLGYFVVTVSENATGNAREGAVAVGELTHTIQQEVAGAVSGIDPESKDVDAAGGSYTVEVDIPTAWTVEGYSGWSWVDPTEGSGPGSVTVTVTPNPNMVERSAEFTIGGYTHAIHQAAASEEEYELVEPQFSPNPDTGPFSGPLDVSLSLPTVGATIQYTTVPNASEQYKSLWPVYTPGEPIVILETTTIKAYAVKGMQGETDVVSATYVISGGVPQVASPQFSPDPATGPFDEYVEVTLSTATPGASVRYTLNELDPHETWTVYVSGQPVVLESSATIWAYGFKDGDLNSADVSATYTVIDDPSRVARPTFSPGAGEGPFVGAVTVSFASATEGASFRYSYEDPAGEGIWTVGDSVEIGRTTSIWVQAFKDGFDDSAIVTASYGLSGSHSGTVEPSTMTSLGLGRPSASDPLSHWKVYVNEEGMGMLIIRSLEDEPAVYDIVVGSDGIVAHEQIDLPSGGSEGAGMAAVVGDFEATVHPDGTVTGEVIGIGTIDGSIDPLTSVGEDICGEYEIDLLYSDYGKCYGIVGTDGSVIVIIVTADGVDECYGQLDSSGHAAMTTVNLSNAELQVDADDGMSLILTPPGADPIEFRGLSADETGTNRLINLSTRGWVGTQSQNMFAGFVITGTGKKPVLIRAMGPALSGDPFNVPGTIADPKIEVIPQGSVKIAENDNWSDGSDVQDLLAAMTVTGAFPTASGSKDAMIVTELDPGTYTAKISGSDGGTGVAIVEVYTVRDLDTPEARQVNISTRGFIGTGGSIMILGMKADGNKPRQFLIRAVGPTLADFGIGGVLSDPVLTVVRISDGTEVATNDDWDEGASGDAIHALSQQLGAFALPRGSKDAVALVTLPTTSGFTVKISGKNGETGVAIAEVYEVP